MPDIDSALKHEEKELIKDKEIQRILGCFRLDYYTILGVQPGITKPDIAKTYKKKSLLIHPDRTKNPRASDAFDLLRKASTALTDDKQRTQLDTAWADARAELIREKSWTIDDPRLVGPEFLIEWRSKVKEILIENEMAKRLNLKKTQLDEARQRKEEQELTRARESQKKQDEKWDLNRMKRVKSWRKFSKKIHHRKKKGTRSKMLI